MCFNDSIVKHSFAHDEIGRNKNADMEQSKLISRTGGFSLHIRPTDYQTLQIGACFYEKVLLKFKNLVKFVDRITKEIS